MHSRYFFFSKNSRNLLTFSVYIFGPKIWLRKFFDKSQVCWLPIYDILLHISFDEIFVGHFSF